MIGRPATEPSFRTPPRKRPLAGGGSGRSFAKGAHCFPNVVASAPAQNFLELDTIGFYLTQQPHQVFIFESSQSFDLLIFA